MTTEDCARLLSDVPLDLRIQIIYQDKDIIVVNKPCHLRTVPGNAESPPPVAVVAVAPSASSGASRKRKASTLNGEATTTTGCSAQEAWVQALDQLCGSSHSTDSDGDDPLRPLLQRLGAQPSQRASIPRRYAAFVRYVQRSRRRILGEQEASSSSGSLEGDDVTEIAKQLFQRIETLQQRLHVRPKPTAPHESVLGQCQMLGLAKPGTSRSHQDLYAVHRLDCATSGLLVLARNQTAASVLSTDWRNRNVSKIYRACVTCWPITESTGCIELPMAPHPTERLKWRVVPPVVNNINKDVHTNPGKPSTTKWTILQRREDDRSAILCLEPVTGRTHQLRVHCAAMGGPIRGDSLYGTEKETASFLYLHAERLSFVHPTTKQRLLFEVPPKW